ncbi:MAG: adenylate cyclase [Crocinitomicaceae bacterium]|jgi:adenylate cyclase
MRKLLLIILITLSGINLKAQTNLDSLYTVWQDETLADSSRAKAYKDYIGKGYLYSNPDTAFILAKNLLSFGEEQKYEKAKAMAYNLMGSSKYLKSDFLSALNYFQRNLKIYEELGDIEGGASAANNMGIIYSSLGNSPKSLFYYHSSLKKYEEIGNKRGIATALNNIGSIFENQKDYPKALDYYQRSKNILEEIGDKRASSSAMGNVGVIYYQLKEYPKALEYYQSSLKLKQEIGDLNGEALTINNIGNIYQMQGDYAKAMDFYQRSLKIREEIGDKWGSANSLNNIGSVYQNQGDHPKALEYCKKALVSYEEIGAINKELVACQCVYDNYKAMGNSNKALEYHEQMLVLKDSIFNEENTKKLTRLEMQYEYDKKETAAKLEQEKKDAIALEKLRRNELIRNGFIGGFGIMLLFAIVFLSQRNKIKKGKKQSDGLLLNILPAEVAEELKAKGATEAKQFDEVSILFTDFKGFTAISEKLNPKELVHDLNVCFSEFDKITTKHGIEKIKTIGDAYMAACGVPIPTPDHAKKTVLAALEMAEFVAAEKQRKEDEDLPFFEVRIGINTGPIVAGIVGVKKFQYDIWGDTVNTASRMESSGEVGKVNISEATYDLLKADPEFAFENRGKIEAKGKGEMEMHFVNLKTEKL